MKKRLLCMLLALAMVLTLLPTTAFAANRVSFNDVASNAWYRDAVDYVYHQGIMSGVGNNHFSPETNLTRAQLCQILYNIEEKPNAGNGSFSDVSEGAWYSKAVNWAASQGIVNGTGNGLFSPDNLISREQMVTILYRYAAYKNYSLSAPVSLDDYSDGNQVSNWAEEAMCWAVSEGIISGTTATTISPKGTASRAQAATILMRFCQRMEAKETFLSKNVDDFHGEEIINFDDSNETNFAVLEEDVLTSKSSAVKNKIVSADEEEGVYVFSNIDKTISSLTSGDVLYLTYGSGEEDYLLFKVGSIEIDGGTATITEGQAELSDYFQYIDVDMDLDLSGADFGKNTAVSYQQGVTTQTHYYAANHDPQQTDVSDAILQSIPSVLAKDIAGSNSANLKFTIGGKSANITADVKLTFKLKISYDKALFGLPVDITEISFSVKQETKLQGRVSKSLTGKTDTYKKETQPVSIPVAVGVDAEFLTYFKFDVDSSVSGSLSATITTESGTKYSRGESQEIRESDADVSLDIGGDFNVSAGLGVTGSVKVLKVLTFSLSGEAGIELDGTQEGIEVSLTKGEKHLCATCIDGAVDVYFELDFSIKVGISEKISWKLVDLKPIKAKIEFAKFYISFQGGSTPAEFGWGKCPHKQYLITVNAKDQDGNKLAGASIELSTKDGMVVWGETTADGVFTAYCDNGDYSVSGMLDGYQTARDSVSVKSKACSVNLILQKGETEQPVNLDDFVIQDGVLIQYRGKGGAITIPNSVTTIRSQVFFDRADLTDVTIPDSVTSIGQWAFYGCTGLTSVTIPNSITTIGDLVFGNCTALTKIQVASNNPSYVDLDGVLFTKDMKTLVEYPGGKKGAYTVPNSVTSIGNTAFYGCKALTSVTIPNSVTSIGMDAFWGCTGLTNITIGNGVTSIGDSAFEGCTGLTSVTIPNSVTSMESSAFEDCTGLTSVTIGNGITEISSETFKGCTGLTSVTIPNSVTSIEFRVFEGCTNLTSVTIPNSVTEIWNETFKGCTGLTSMSIPNGVTSIGMHTFEGCAGLTSVTIPNSITDIGSGTFKSCTGLTSLTIPNSVTSIQYGVCEGCTNLRDVYYGGGEAQWKRIDMWGGNDILTAATIHYTSQPAINMSDFEINDGVLVKYKGYGGAVIIPNSVTSIGDNAFYGYKYLTSVTIPDGVTKIGEHAFALCMDLTSITIPGSLTRIEGAAFAFCTSLKDVYYSGTEEQWSNIFIETNIGLGTVYGTEGNEHLLSATIHYNSTGM